MSEVSVIVDDAYERHIACSSRVTVLLGSRVALVIDEECGLQVGSWIAIPSTLVAVGACIDSIERLLAAFDGCVGRVPTAVRPYHGRATRIEVAFLEGAAGLAHHGVAGCAVGPAFIGDMVRAAAADAALVASFSGSATSLVTGLSAVTVTMPHVLCYELCRNYIFPEEFTPVLDYCLFASRDAGAALSPSCWGWVNQGFVNVLGTLLLDQLEDPIVGFSYHGHSRDKFLGDMEAHLARYVAGGGTWEDTFMHERLRWDPNSSLDNVYSGILISLWRAHGRGAFLTRFFQALKNLRPVSKDDVQGARENFALAAGRAARADLTGYFATLRWPLRPTAAAALITAAALLSLT